MVTVAITGVAGLLGSSLAAELDGNTAVDRIVGLDLAAPHQVSSDKLAFREVDIRDPNFDRYLDDVDVLVHLAFQMDPIRDLDTMRSINIDGTRNVFEAAVRAGVDKVVYNSSAVAYGAHPDNDFPLTEDSPLRANPGFPYAEHKLELERWLDEWLREHDDDLTVTVLRPTVVAGPGVDNFITRMSFESPRPVLVRGHRPPLQFVHVEDVVSALVHVIEEDLPGAFNVSAEGWLSMDEVLAVAGRKPAEVPEEVAFTTTERLWDLGLSEAQPGVVPYYMHPWVVSPEKLIETGWRPKRSNRDALAQLVEEHRDWIAVGTLRARRSTLRRIAAVTGLLAGAATVRAIVRRRRS
ncbi:MAG: NAD-dependent epimerase/dehydratase family protein [Nitriliruptorales bacterium]|nr:NAD-dependent epimerase/dehydratase family protein [Nitriliruptorales bacterium]